MGLNDGLNVEIAGGLSSLITPYHFSILETVNNKVYIDCRAILNPQDLTKVLTGAD